jgi:hypothetical protein
MFLVFLIVRNRDAPVPRLAGIGASHTD